jgi:plastocyanin
MSNKSAAIAVAVAILILGCVTSDSYDEIEKIENASSNLTQEPSNQDILTTSTTTWQNPNPPYENPQDCIVPPGDGCVCERWICPTTTNIIPTTTATVPRTTTTCITVDNPNYIPETRRYHVIITEGRFRPDEITAFLGDTVIVEIENLRGLHTIRETYSNRTLILRPNETYELIFYAVSEGEHLLTCNPFCVDPMEARIIVKKPTLRQC